MTPADVCDAIKFCGAMANAIAWGKVGAVVAALALTYGVAMSIALVGYVWQVPRPTDDAPPPSARLCSSPTTDTAEVIANRRGSMRPTIGAGPRRPI
jgi:hypothetical protein